MSDRYHGSAYRGGGGGGNRHPRSDDRRYPPPSRSYHQPYPRDDYSDSRGAPYDPYAPSSYYADSRGGAYVERRPRRVHKAIPPPRPWDYSRRAPPRNEHERAQLERERLAWEAKEEERYRQRMAERDRESERDRERGGNGAHGWDRDFEEARMYRSAGAEAYDRERPRYVGSGPPSRPRSRSPIGADPRYETRGSWGRTSLGSAEGREREAATTAGTGAPSSEREAYPPRRSSPPPSYTPAAPSLDTSEAPRQRSEYQERDTPHGPSSREAGFISTPPTGPRASRGGPPIPSPALRGGRENSGSVGPYTPSSDGGEASNFFSPSTARFSRSAREAPSGPYRGGHPSFGRGRRDTNPYETGYPAADDDVGYRGYGGHAGSSPHEASPYSPSTATTPGGAHLAAPRLSRTSSSQTPTVTASGSILTGSSSLASPSTLQPSVSKEIHFSAAYRLCPDLDNELQTVESQRNAFISNYVLGIKRTAIRKARVELKDAEMEYANASNKRQAVEKMLDVAKETADAYSLEENRKEELARVMDAQLQQSVAQIAQPVQ
ncbi:uncharacterized protein MEPE_06309 [Melanopsichium pennsylvanicum]|uniref:Uncharacterized protein n=2 Tax=Melanopsichium pennsylvanicum TaxID=63383 RepID=A0AAJ5C8K6_9BASI|nr:conserved hypothetical protein [Melanopsichium pennsylvanicum 4]SNX87599.1 uncharacterized protein MEPE_06309 [Melanopsichium pennsylvanicum]